MRRHTQDYDAASGDEASQRIRFFITEKLGEHQALTPEGFLVITDVPLCRTGVLIYGPNEVPVRSGADGTVKIYREPEAVFDATHLASIQGKAVVNDHPPDDVRPDNWKRYTVGTILNPRRGEDSQSDLLIADLIIMDPAAIADIRAGKREVSMGYDADYEEVSPGVGRQLNLLANHVALVEAGRCGPRCAIKDANTFSIEGDDMKTRDNAVSAKARRVSLSDEAIAQIGEILSNESANDEGGEHTHIHVHAPGGEPNPGSGMQHDDESLQAFMEQNASEHANFEQRIAALEAKIAGAGAGTGDEETEEEKKAREEKERQAQNDTEAEAKLEEELAEEAPAGTQDKARKARDSVYLDDSFKATVAGAEILVPGIRVPTFDAKQSAKDSLAAICGLRRRAIDLAYATNDGQAIIHELTGGKAPDLPSMSCGEVRNLFRGAVVAKKAANNAARHSTGDDRSGHHQSAGPIRTPADFNKMANAHWSGKH